MNTNLFEYGMQRYPMQSSCTLNPFSIFAVCAHHSSHHHEHPAH